MNLYDLAARLDALANEQERLECTGGPLGQRYGSTRSRPLDLDALAEWEQTKEVLAEVISIVEQTFAATAPSILAQSMDKAAKAVEEWESRNSVPAHPSPPSGIAVPADAQGAGQRDRQA